MFLRFTRIPPLLFRGYTTSKSVFPKENDIILKCTLRSQAAAIQKNYATEAAASRVAVSREKYETSRIRNDLPLPIEITLAKVQTHVNEFECINQKEFEMLLEHFEKMEYLPMSHSLFMIHCCGNILRYIDNKNRMKLVKAVWSTISKTPLDISHYNALLQVYIENEHEFCPLEFLKLLKEKNIEPNRVTFQKLVSQYCSKGNIKGATEILEYMNEKGLPLSPIIFNALIIGHSQANDLESAIKILDVMKQAGVEYTLETYEALLQAYAKHGDVKNMKKIIANCQANEILLTDESLLQAIYVLTLNGHKQHVGEFLSIMLKMNKYDLEASNVIFKLVQKNHDDVALQILLSIPSHMGGRRGSMPSIYSAYLRQLIDRNETEEKIVETCNVLAKTVAQYAYQAALRNSLGLKKNDLSFAILSAMQNKNEKIKEHFFWPILASDAEKLNLEELQNTMKKMITVYKTEPSIKTIMTYMMPYIQKGSMRDYLSALESAGLSKELAVNALVYYKFAEGRYKSALNMVQSNPSVKFNIALVEPLIELLNKFEDQETFIQFVRLFYEKHDTHYISDNVTYAEDFPNVPFMDFVALKVAHLLPRFKETTMIEVYENMIKEGLGITKETAEAIKDRFNDRMEDRLSNALDTLSSGDLIPTALPTSNVSDITHGFSIMIGHLYESCEKDECEKAEKLFDECKSQGHKMSPGTYVTMINMYMREEDVEKAKMYMNELFEKYPDCQLRPTILTTYTKFLIFFKLYDEALEFLKRQKQETPIKKFGRNEQEILDDISKTGNSELLDQFLMTFQQSGLPNSDIVSDLVRRPLHRGEHQIALEKFEWVCKHHRKTPYKFELMEKFVMAEDAVSLQRVTDACTLAYGEMKALFDLAMSFMECGRLNQAKKILQTPGIILESWHFENTALYYKDKGMEEQLMLLIEVTKSLRMVNRVKLYETLLECYDSKQNWQKGLALWTQMQEENVIPSELFLKTLQTLLLENGQSVPFTTSYSHV